MATLLWPFYNLVSMGILDSKTRVLDSIITLEGRKQLANGGINIRYVSFTDNATFYAADLENGSADATARIYLEACHLPQDEITFHADESGRLLALKSAADVVIKSGQLLKTTFDPSLTLTGSNKSMFETSTLRGDFLQDYAAGLLTSSIDNFKKQHIIGTKDSFFEDDGFAMSNKEIEFVIHNDRPISEKNGFIANISHLEDIHADPRFSNVQNFKFLPPINKTDEVIDKTTIENLKPHLLGSYPAWGPTKKLTHTDVINEHMQYAKTGYVKTVSFEPTSRANNLFMQAFEVTNDTMFKLDIIDFGVWNAPHNSSFAEQITANMPGQTMHILFVGKLITKPESETHSFIHLFTLIFG
jgi:hypothetical protein